MLENYNDVLKIDDIMKILQIGRNSAYKLINDGVIKSIKVGKNIRIPKTYLLDFFAEKYYNGDSDMKCASIPVVKGA